MKTMSVTSTVTITQNMSTDLTARLLANGAGANTAVNGALTQGGK